MRYVAFDIESSDGYFASGNLCEFGYVVADEDFNIIEQRNILVRPINNNFNSSFHVKLAYPISMYRSADMFVYSYPRIYDLLCADDVLVLGHAVHNDITCINSACRINTLPLFHFRYIDTQVLYSAFSGKSNVMSLDKISEEIGETFLHHRADEDARMSLLTLRHILRQKNMTFDELIADMNITLGENNCGEIVGFRVDGGVSNMPSVNSKNSKRRILSMFVPQLPDDSSIDKSNELYKKKIYIDNDICLDDIDLTRAVIQKLALLGAKEIRNPMESDILVGYRGKEKPEKGISLSMAEFLEKLGKLDVRSYDDEAILKQYMKERTERKQRERLARVQAAKNKMLSKKSGKGNKKSAINSET